MNIGTGQGRDTFDRVQSPRSNVQGRRSEARNPDFGLWTAGLWTNTGTGHVVSPRKSRRIRPWQRPVRTSSGRAAGRDRNGTGLNCTERDGIGTGSVRERSRRDTRTDGTWDRIGVGGAPGPGTPTGRDISGPGRDGIESGPDCSRGVGRRSPITNLRHVRRSGNNLVNGMHGGQDRLLGQRSQTPLLRLSRPLGLQEGDLGIAGSWACAALRRRQLMSRPVEPAERLLRTAQKRRVAWSRIEPATAMFARCRRGVAAKRGPLSPGDSDSADTAPALLSATARRTDSKWPRFDWWLRALLQRRSQIRRDTPCCGLSC